MVDDLRTGRHCVFMIHAHLIFITKYRGKILNDEILSDMENIMLSVCDQFEAALKEFNGKKDPVHLLVNYPPKVSLSKLINSLRNVHKITSSSSEIDKLNKRGHSKVGKNPHFV